MTGLSNKRETKPSAETGNKKSLSFSNAKIEKYFPTFGNARNLYIPFKVPYGSHLKGLCLRVSQFLNKCKSNFFIKLQLFYNLQVPQYLFCSLQKNYCLKF